MFKFRRLAQFSLRDLPRNAQLRSMLGQFSQISCLRECEAEVGEVTVVVASNNKRQIRGLQQRALVTSILNLGPSVARIFEDDILIFMLDPGEWCEMPLGGKHALQGDGVSGSASVYILTQLRCACGDPDYAHNINSELAPVGGFLL